MLTKIQLKIFAAFKEELFAKLTFRQIKEKARQKSNNIIQIALKEFQKQEIVITEKVGDVNVYSLNLKSNLAKSYLAIIAFWFVQQNKKLPKKVLQSIQERIFKNSPFFILLVFGSYARDTATANSDLDIALIAETEQSKKDIIPYVETIKRRETMSIDYHIFTCSEFLEMLTAEQENVGKEIYRKNIIYYGVEQYYSLIENLQNGKII